MIPFSPCRVGAGQRPPRFGAVPSVYWARPDALFTPTRGVPPMTSFLRG